MPSPWPHSCTFSQTLILRKPKWEPLQVCTVLSDTGLNTGLLNDASRPWYRLSEHVNGLQLKCGSKRHVNCLFPRAVNPEMEMPVF